MFQIGWGELLVVLIVALWALGPERMPAVARVCGRYLAQFKRTFLSVKNEFTREFSHTALKTRDPKASEDAQSRE